MPATYEPIATTTLSSAAADITFSSIPSTYTDLKLVVVAQGSLGNQFAIQFNGSSTGYSRTYLYGDGTAAASDRGSATSVRLDYLPTSTNFAFYDIDILSYAGSTNKTLLAKSAKDLNGSGEVHAQVSLWANTAAINQIKLFVASSGNLNSGTTATIYGILKA